MKQNITKIMTNYKLALVALLVALVAIQAPVFVATVAAQTASAADEELKSALPAKRALTRVDERSLGKIKDERMRSAIQRSYKALKALASNKSPAREAKLVAEFDQTIKALKAFPQPDPTTYQQCDSQYEVCLEICKEIGGCNMCGLVQNACYLTKLAAEWTKDPLDPTP